MKQTKIDHAARARNMIGAAIHNDGLANVLAGLGRELAAIVNEKNLAGTPFADGDEKGFRNACLNAIKSTWKDRDARGGDYLALIDLVEPISIKTAWAQVTKIEDPLLSQQMLQSACCPVFLVTVRFRNEADNDETRFYRIFAHTEVRARTLAVINLKKEANSFAVVSTTVEQEVR